MIILKSKIKDELTKYFNKGYKQAVKVKDEEIEEIYKYHKQELFLKDQLHEANLKIAKEQIEEYKRKEKEVFKMKREVQKKESLLNNIALTLSENFKTWNESNFRISGNFNKCVDEIDRLKELQ